MMDEDYNYGHYPGDMRWAFDQVPLEVASQKNTLNHVGARSCFLRGAKYDFTKRLATIQLFARAEGDQCMKPILIFKGKPNPENPIFDQEKQKLPEKREKNMMTMFTF